MREIQLIFSCHREVEHALLSMLWVQTVNLKMLEVTCLEESSIRARLDLLHLKLQEIELCYLLELHVRWKNSLLLLSVALWVTANLANETYISLSNLL